MSQEKILVLDFGGQYTQLIAKKVRQCNVFSKIVPHNHDIGRIKFENPSGLILSGGPASVYEEGAPQIDKKIFELGIPILGICYGMQLTNYTLGGGILHSSDVIKEYGETLVSVDNNHSLFSGLDKNITAWMSHGDSVDQSNLTDGFKIIGETKNHVASIANDEKKIYGVQFHPEVTHTPKGKDIVSNFVHNICGCGNEWNMGNYIEQCKIYIQKTVGKNDVINFVSGGVDSSFVAAVLSKTENIGKVHNIYIGALMRKNENEEVVESLKKAGVKNLIFKECEDRFIKAVDGMSDPEEKRKAIGNLFGEIQQEMCEKLDLDPDKTFLAQGTLYTDLIESGKGVGKKASNIKSHHNVGCKFIEDMREKGLIVEPNRLIFKDEVRGAAKEIGLPPEIYGRQPYPGPGLGIRIVDGDCAWLQGDYKGISQRVSDIAKREGLDGYSIPIKTVGVQGDGRTYSFLSVLRGVRDWQKIRSAAKKIPTEVRETNRIIYNIGQEKTNDLTNHLLIPCKVNRETVDQIKNIDYEGRQIIAKHGFDDLSNISQTIFVLFGADMYNRGKRSVALRAVKTDDFMTVKPVEIGNKTLSWDCLDEINKTLLKKYDVGSFFYDVTDKPPSTVCWE